MNEQDLLIVTCPKCGKESEFNVYTDIDVSFEPELRDKVRSGELFTFTCPKCGHRMRIDHGFKYHDPEYKLMILYANEAGCSEIPPLFMEGFDLNRVVYLSQGYIIRLVTDYNRFVEKLQIFYNHFDDRAIELAKRVSINMLHQSRPEYKVISDALFFVSKDGDMVLHFLNEEGRPMGAMELMQKVYEDAASDVAEMEELRGADLSIVDKTWAMKRNGEIVAECAEAGDAEREKEIRDVTS